VERDAGEGTTTVGKEKPYFPQFFAFDTNSKEKEERERKRRNSATIFFMPKNKDELTGREMWRLRGTVMRGRHFQKNSRDIKPNN
jgi:hypothetical protein